MWQSTLRWFQPLNGMARIFQYGFCFMIWYVYPGPNQINVRVFRLPHKPVTPSVCRSLSPLSDPDSLNPCTGTSIFRSLFLSSLTQSYPNLSQDYLGFRVCFKKEIFAFMACSDSRFWGFSAYFVKKIGAFIACYHSKFWVIEFVTIDIKMHFSSVPSPILINSLKCWLLFSVSSTNFSTTVPFLIAYK